MPQRAKANGNHISIIQINGDGNVVEIGGPHLSLELQTSVYGNIDDRRMALRVGGYRVEGQKPLIRDQDPGQPDDDFKRTHFNSMTFSFERESEAIEFHERFS